MNRRLIVICSIISVTILIVGLVVYSWYIMPQNTSQTEVEAKITDFTADMSFKGCLVGVTTDLWFNITVQNMGTAEINGANITVERIADVNDTSICSYDNVSLGILHLNETRQVKAIILTDINHFDEVASSNFKASLIVNGTLLDERKLL